MKFEGARACVYSANNEKSEEERRGEGWKLLIKENILEPLFFGLRGRRLVRARPLVVVILLVRAGGDPGRRQLESQSGHTA